MTPCFRGPVLPKKLEAEFGDRIRSPGVEERFLAFHQVGGQRMLGRVRQVWTVCCRGSMEYLGKVEVLETHRPDGPIVGVRIVVWDLFPWVFVEGVCSDGRKAELRWFEDGLLRANGVSEKDVRR